MDSSEHSAAYPLTTNPPIRRELQGPRPTPLKLNKDSHKIKKPPVAPPAKQQTAFPPPQHRRPIIIYAVSPKVIHADPSEFMSVVQRLTGASTSQGNPNSASDVVLTPRLDTTTGKVISPAARMATYEKTRIASSQNVLMNQVGVLEDLNGENNKTFLDRFGLFPTGILSPLPSSLPSISPNFFSPSLLIQNHNSIVSPYLSSMNYQNPSSSMTPNVLSSLINMNPNPNPSPNQLNLLDFNNFMASPTNLLSTSILPSPPGGYWDLFNQYQDL